MTGSLDAQYLSVLCRAYSRAYFSDFNDCRSFDTTIFPTLVLHDCTSNKCLVLPCYLHLLNVFKQIEIICVCD